MFKKVILNIENKKIHIESIKKFLWEKKINKWFDMEQINEYARFIKGANINIRFKEQEIYIVPLTIPKIKEKFICHMIENELEIEFKDMKDIFFEYRVLEKQEKQLKLLVYCVKCEIEPLIQCMSKNSATVQSMLPIQICALNKYIITVKTKWFIFVYKNNSNIYMVSVYDKNIVENSILKFGGNLNLEQIAKEIVSLTIKSKVMIPDFNLSKVYFENIELKTCAYILENIKRISVEPQNTFINKDMSYEAI